MSIYFFWANKSGSLGVTEQVSTHITSSIDIIIDAKR
jgi:hypothetical protein